MKNNQTIFPLFGHHISELAKKQKLENITSIPNANKNLNSNPLSFQEILGLNLKGLQAYNKNLNTFISKWNNKKLILSLKNNTNTNTNINIMPVTPKPNLNLNFFSSITASASQLPTNTNDTSSFALAAPAEEAPATIIKISDYLKSITLFNSTPSLKDGRVFNYAKEISYKYNVTNNNRLSKTLYTFLLCAFFSMNSLISKPVYVITPEKVVIHLFVFLFKNNSSVKGKISRNASVKQEGASVNSLNKDNSFLTNNELKLNRILNVLSRIFKKPVELEIVRLHYPYFDSNILVNLLSVLINKIPVRIIVQKFFKKAVIKNPARLKRKNIVSIIPSFLSGIKIRVAGRLLTHRVVPRQTVKTTRRGALARSKVNYLDNARFTHKNKRGAFSITISTGQNINN